MTRPKSETVLPGETVLPEARMPSDQISELLTQPEEAARLGGQMKALHRYISSQVMGAMQEQLQGDDLSFSQMSALHQLRAHAPLSVGGLAERTGLSLPAASHLTDRLVVRGYAQRRENPDDRRAKLLDLSERGQEIVDSMDRRFTETYHVAFSKVSPAAIKAAADSVERLLQELLLDGSLHCSSRQARGADPQTACSEPRIPSSEPHSGPEQDPDQDIAAEVAPQEHV